MEIHLTQLKGNRRRLIRTHLTRRAPETGGRQRLASEVAGLPM